MTIPTVHAITDRRIAMLTDLDRRTAALARAGAALHARGRDLSGQKHWDLARMFASLTSKGLFVNDRADIALLVGAAGLVLGERSLPVPAARELVGPRCLLGRSVHDAIGAQAAVEDGADFLLAGAVFRTATHPKGPTLGLDGLAEIATMGLPVVAIGGITLQNVEAVRRRGADAVAAIRALWDAPDPGEAAYALREIMECTP